MFRMKSSVFFAKKNRVRVLTFFLLVQVFSTVSCSPSRDRNSQKSNVIDAQTRLLLNTICAANLYGDGTPELYDEIFDRIAQIEQDFSAHIDTSYVSQINAAAGKHAVAVPDDVLFVINAAIEYARLTDGAFDPTVGPLVDLWGINTDTQRVPTQAEIDAALPLIDWHDVEVRPLENASENAEASTSGAVSTVFLRREGMALDLGGIAKGYAADEVVRILQERGVKQAIVDLGGNIYVFGKKADGSSWRVGIKNPNNPEGTPALVLTTENSTVVTSGVYERFFVADNIRYHHILDTRTGYPAQTGLLSTTIVCESSMTADALSTSVFLLGKERGLKLLEKLDAQKTMVNVPGLGAGVSGIFISDKDEVSASAVLRDALVPTQSYAKKISFE